MGSLRRLSKPPAMFRSLVAFLLVYSTKVQIIGARSAKCPFRASITSGREKVTCDFSLLCSNGAVQSKQSKAKCFPIVKKKLTFKKVKITAKDGCRWVVNMVLAKGIGKISSVTYSRCKCCDGTSTPPPPPPPTPPPPTTTTPPPPPVPTLPPPTPPPMPVGPAPSQCCPNITILGSESVSGIYLFVGEAETVPSCSDNCLYQRDQIQPSPLYCFQNSPQFVANEICTYESNESYPLISLGFSDWSEWSECEGVCDLDMSGQSYRERTCSSDINDDLSCSGPTRQVRPCEMENCPSSSSRGTNCNDIVEGCDPATFPTNVKVLGYPCKYHFVDPCATWHDAQTACQNNFFGKLWEPANKAEYAAVLSAAEAQAQTSLGGCRWWLGLFNWNYGAPYSKETFLSSLLPISATSPYYPEPSPRPNSAISNFITVKDGADNNENCVHTKKGNWNLWNDLNCDGKRLNFICQSCPSVCTCQHDGVLYPCGSIIQANAKSCSNLLCTQKGKVVKEQQFWDYCIGVQRNPSSGCCTWRGDMYRDGAEWGPWHARKVCARGEVLSSRFVWPFGSSVDTLPGSTIWSVKSMEDNGVQYIIEDKFNQETGIYYKNVPGYGNVVKSETAVDILTGLAITCTENDNCVLYTLEATIDPFAEIAMLSSSDDLSLTKRYFIQRIGQRKQKQIPQEFKDLAVGRMIYLMERKEISQIEFDQLVSSAQTQFNEDRVLVSVKFGLEYFLTIEINISTTTTLQPPATTAARKLATQTTTTTANQTTTTALNTTETAL